MTPAWRSSIRIARVLVVVISGPIASGKSALSRAVAVQLEEAEEGCDGGVDLDLVHETLDTKRRTKDDADLWAEARRVAGQLTNARCSKSLRRGRGEFASDQALDEFVSEVARHRRPASSASRRGLSDGVETRIGRCNSRSVEG